MVRTRISENRCPNVYPGCLWLLFSLFDSICQNDQLSNKDLLNGQLHERIVYLFGKKQVVASCLTANPNKLKDKNRKKSAGGEGG